MVCEGHKRDKDIFPTIFEKGFRVKHFYHHHYTRRIIVSLCGSQTVKILFSFHKQRNGENEFNLRRIYLMLKTSVLHMVNKLSKI